MGTSSKVNFAKLFERCVALLIASANYWPVASRADPPPLSRPPVNFPNETTSGVPSRTDLAHSSGMVINSPNTIIRALDIDGSVVINAPNTTLLDCKITANSYDVVVIRPHITGTLIKNCEINNLGAGGQCIAGQGTFIGNNIHDCADGIDVRGDNTVIEDNYIHAMRGTSGSHFDGIQADGGFSNLSVKHNTVVNEQNQTSAIMLDNYRGPINNVRIQNNLLIGGGYTVYINEVARGQPVGGPVTNVIFSDNVLGKGTWGYLDLRTELNNIPEFSGNVDVSGTLLQLGKR
jgi:Right handed beta helix region